MYKAASSLAWALVGGELSASLPGLFTAEKGLRYPLDRRLENQDGQHGGEKILDPTGT
jgi:hypothetical protein